MSRETLMEGLEEDDEKEKGIKMKRMMGHQ